jgi:hypothetical protein
MALSLARVSMLVVAGLPLFAQAKGPEVTVVNTPKNPVPVQLEQTKPIPVTIEGGAASSVTIANTAKNPVPVTGDVKVANPESQPVPVRQRDHAFDAFTVSAITSPSQHAVLVERAQRMVIESIHVTCDGQPPPRYATILWGFEGRDAVGIALIPMTELTSTFSAGMLATKLYVDPVVRSDGTISLFVSQGGYCAFTVVGYVP